MKSHRAWYGSLCAVLALSLCACGEDPPPPKARSAVAAPAKPTPVVQAARPIAKPGSRPGDIARLIAIANEDFAASRFVSPPSANALEGFLEVRELDPDNGSVREAMGDLYPLATAAVREAIDARDLAEAERILALVERGMAGALGVAELRTELNGLKAAESGRDGSSDEVPAATDSTQPSTAMADKPTAAETAENAAQRTPPGSAPVSASGTVPPP